MKDKLNLLKKQKHQLAILALCSTLALGGCGATNTTNNNESSKTGGYVITYNMDNAVIFEMDQYEFGGNQQMLDKSMNPTFEITSPFIFIKYEDENSKEYAYSVALSLVGEEGTITFYDVDDQLKLTK